ncbi:hypothetical protein [Nocardioides sp. NPDC006303]|uniref:hypothetical protein n=1 Tax=Nocardioides sp. NPDC006303 TaxID=3156747 RepID=UPI0033ADCC9A
MKSRRLRRGWLLALAMATALVANPIQPATGADPETVNEVRTRLLGAGWDDPNEIRGRSIGNTTWLVSYGGTVILHDSTIEDQLTDTGENAETNGYVSLDDIVAAKPVAILQDHTHFDQQHHAAQVAARAGTPIVTDLGGCVWTKTDAIKLGLDPADVNCNLIRDASGKPFFTNDSYFLPVGQGLDLGIDDLLDGLNLNPDLSGAVGEDATLGDFFTFTAYGDKGWPEDPLPGGIDAMATQIKHSPTFTNRPYPEHLDSGPSVDPLASAQDMLEDYKDASPEEIANNIWGIYAPFDLEGSNIAWRVKYRDFSLVHHGSTGPTNAIEPGATDVKRALETLSQDDRVDLEIGGLAEQVFYLYGGESHPEQKEYARAIGAKKYFPTHHYNWFPQWLTQPAATYWPAMQETWAAGRKEYGTKFPEMCYLTEDNYATLWSTKASTWAGDKVGTFTPLTGPGCYTG